MIWITKNGDSSIHSRLLLTLQKDTVLPGFRRGMILGYI